MAFLSISEKFLAIACSDLVSVFDIKNGKLIKELSIDAANVEDSGKNSTNANACQALCCDISENFLSVGNNRKQLLIWDTNTWAEPNITALSKPGTALKLVFLGNSETALVADRSGSVVAIPTLGGSNSAVDEWELLVGTIEELDSEEEEEEEEESSKTTEKMRARPKTILGHCSMLLDLALSNDGKFLVTCDRDEKIRVSRFPKVYNVESMCVGHSEYVRSVTFCQTENGEEMLISASGDGKLKFWDHKTGTCLQTEEIVPKPTDPEVRNGQESADKPSEKTGSLIGQIRKVTCSPIDGTLLAVSFEQQPKIVEIYRICLKQSDATDEKTTAAEKSVTKIQTVHFDVSIWDLSFDGSGALWVLNTLGRDGVKYNGGEVKSPLTVWKWVENGEKSELVLDREIQLSENLSEGAFFVILEN